MDSKVRSSVMLSCDKISSKQKTVRRAATTNSIHMNSTAERESGGTAATIGRRSTASNGFVVGGADSALPCRLFLSGFLFYAVVFGLGPFVRPVMVRGSGATAGCDGKGRPDEHVRPTQNKGSARFPVTGG